MRSGWFTPLQVDVMNCTSLYFGYEGALGAALINADRLTYAAHARRRRDWWTSLRQSHRLTHFAHLPAHLRIALGPVFLGEGLEFYFVDWGSTCSAEFFLNLPSHDREQVWSDVMDASPRLEAAFGSSLSFSDFTVGASIDGGSHARKACWPEIQARLADAMNRLLHAVDLELASLTDSAIDLDVVDDHWASRQEHWRRVAERDNVECAYLEVQVLAVNREMERRRRLN